MSYILDALRRADAERERERGAVPSLHAQPTLATEAPGWRHRSMTLIGGAVFAAVLVAALVWAWPDREGPPAASGPRAAPDVAAPSAPSDLPAPSRPEPPRVVVAAPTPVASAPRAPPPASAAALTSPAATAPAPLPVAVARPADSPIIPLAELSPEMRRAMPVMAIGGGIYSENSASRFILVGGQVVREGESAAPGVTVERIGPKSAVMRWNGMRIDVPL